MQVYNFLLYLFAVAIKCKSKMNKQKLKEQGVDILSRDGINEQGGNFSEN